MRKEWLEDKESKKMQKYLATIGCPMAGTLPRVDVTSKVWRDPGVAEEEDGPPKPLRKLLMKS